MSDEPTLAAAARQAAKSILRFQAVYQRLTLLTPRASRAPKIRSTLR